MVPTFFFYLILQILTHPVEVAGYTAITPNQPPQTLPPSKNLGKLKMQLKPFTSSSCGAYFNSKICFYVSLQNIQAFICSIKIKTPR